MKGFTLVELLVAAAISLTIIGAVFTLLDPAHGAFRVQPAMADLQQRLRVGVDTLGGTIRLAGAGLAGRLAPVMPYRVGDDGGDPAAGVFFREDVVSVLFVPAAAAATILSVATGGGALPVTARAPCLAAGRRALCGFASGDRVIVVGPHGGWDAMRLTGVDDAALQLEHDGAISVTHAVGEAVTRVEVHTYSLAADAEAGTYQLMHAEGGGSTLPVVDDVVRLEFAYLGDPRPPTRPEPPKVGAPGVFGWPPGENCVFVVIDGQHAPRLPDLGDEPVRMTDDMLSDGPWCPHAASVNRFDADLLRLRRVAVRLRVQVAAEVLRGRGSLFLAPGTSRGGQRTVPDQEIRFDVAPRNLQVER